MNCIFCKTSSDDSRSVEHIIPESLGNTTFILPRGVVCDRCNNYLARKVEKPFLDSQALQDLRFHQAVPNKRGKVPPKTALLWPGHRAVLRRYPSGPISTVVELESVEAFKHLFSHSRHRLIFPVESESPAPRSVSRFLAKAALEAIAARLLPSEEALESLNDEPLFEPLRRYARLGEPTNWPHHERRIYSADRHFTTGDGTVEQTVWECDFLHTDESELYFVLAIFGLELTLNVGGPEIDGYQAWLRKNNDASPLYMGKDPALRP